MVEPAATRQVAHPAAAPLVVHPRVAHPRPVVEARAADSALAEPRTSVVRRQAAPREQAARAPVRRARTRRGVWFGVTTSRAPRARPSTAANGPTTPAPTGSTVSFRPTRLAT